jgi:hypothetical protein
MYRWSLFVVASVVIVIVTVTGFRVKSMLSVA